MTYQIKGWGAVSLSLSTLLVSAVLVFSAAPAAQNQSDEPRVTVTDSSAEREKAPNNKHAEKSTKEPLEKQSDNKQPAPNFKPSEEISEDSPVPFPVDI